MREREHGRQEERRGNTPSAFSLQITVLELVFSAMTQQMPLEFSTHLFFFFFFCPQQQLPSLSPLFQMFKPLLFLFQTVEVGVSQLVGRKLKVGLIGSRLPGQFIYYLYIIYRKYIGYDIVISMSIYLYILILYLLFM